MDNWEVRKMADKKKIVFLGFLPGFGGAERSMIMTANALANLGYDVTIISFKDNNVVYEINRNVNYIFIPDCGGSKIKKQLWRFRNLKDKLSHIKPEVVISFWLQPAIFSAILSKFVGFKVIYSERGDPTDEEYKGFLGFLRDIFFNFIDGFVFQTEGAKKCFSESIQKRGVVINNPVYIKYDDFPIPTERKKVIVNVGRLHEQKNQFLLIDAFAKISNEFSEYNLEIYGQGELESELKDLIKRLKLEDRVILKGTTNNLFAEIFDASLFVLSSNYEGMPNALMEAMALGIPCISTDCKPGGVRELIVNGKNGLITSMNSVEELSEAMKYMLDNPEKASLMGKNAKEICKTHSPDDIFKIWDKFIKKFIRSNKENERVGAEK